MEKLFSVNFLSPHQLRYFGKGFSHTHTHTPFKMFVYTKTDWFQAVDDKKPSSPLGTLTNSSFSLHFLCINAFEMCQFNKVGSLDLSQWGKGMITFCFRIKTKSTFCLVCSFFPENTLDEESDFFCSDVSISVMIILWPRTYF